MSLMTSHNVLHTAANDPRELEVLYQASVKSGSAGGFAEAIEAGYTEQPENLLYAAWHYRLAYAAAQTVERRKVAWLAAIVLAALNGLIYWALSDGQNSLLSRLTGDDMPDIMLLWAPIAALFALAFLTWAGRRAWGQAVLLALPAVAFAALPFFVYGMLSSVALQEQYLILAVFQLPLIAWSIVGIFVLRRAMDRTNAFAFLIKSFEVIVMGGLFVIALGVFTGVSMALFEALGVTMPLWAQRLFVPGSVGLVPVLAIAIIYNPLVPPALQSFEEGLSRLIAVLMRVMLPLTLAILVIYLAFIPFNFWEPFRNRDVLIIYNAMLFAVMALLVGATPVSLHDVAPGQQRWLRRGLVAVALLALVVGLYALSALTYRTLQEGWTPNRLTFIGWNIINSILLLVLLIGQWRSDSQNWLPAMKTTFRAGMIAYAVWGVAVLLLLPLLF